MSKLVSFDVGRNLGTYESFNLRNADGKKIVISFSGTQKQLELSETDYELLLSNDRFNSLVSDEIISVKDITEALEKEKVAELPTKSKTPNSK